MQNSLVFALGCSLSLIACGDFVVPAADSGATESDASATDIDASTAEVDCGNNNTDPGETCDDGNQTSGDGCSAVCLDETLTCVPTKIGPLFNLPTSVGSMVADQGRLYLSGSPFQNNPVHRILRVDDPMAISELGTFQFSDDDRPTARIRGMVKRGDLVWLAGNDPGLAAFNVGDPTNASQAFLRLNPASDGPLALVGDDYLIVAQSQAERPALYKISGGTADFSTALGNSGDVYYNVGAGGQLAFASTFTNNIDIFASNGDPESMSVVGRYSHGEAWSSSSGVRTITAEGDLMAFSVTSGGAVGVHLVDVGNPSAPAFRATIDERPGAMILRDGFLYLTYREGVKVYDVSNPLAPTLAGSVVEFEFNAEALAIDGPHTFVAGENRILTVRGLPGLCPAVCGNNTREYPEACDDGNHDDGDGCSASCEAE